MPIALIEEFIQDCKDSMKDLLEMREEIKSMHMKHRFDEDQSIAVGFEEILEGLRGEFISIKQELKCLLKELKELKADGNENSKTMAS